DADERQRTTDGQRLAELTARLLAFLPVRHVRSVLRTQVANGALAVTRKSSADRCDRSAELPYRRSVTDYRDQAPRLRKASAAPTSRLPIPKITGMLVPLPVKGSSPWTGGVACVVVDLAVVGTVLPWWPSVVVVTIVVEPSDSVLVVVGS